MMNADASRGVDIDARLGIKVDWFLPAPIGLLVARARAAGRRHRARHPRRPWPGPGRRAATADPGAWPAAGGAAPARGSAGAASPAGAAASAAAIAAPPTR